jgi:hypothetical protein
VGSIGPDAAAAGVDRPRAQSFGRWHSCCSLGVAMKRHADGDGGGQSNGLECSVTENGVAHVFRPFEVGVRCACGRKLVVEAEDGLDITDTETEAA